MGCQASNLKIMPLHLIKLCVGADSIEDLRQWVEERLARRKREGLPSATHHVTRMVPARREELLSGGSLYWVIKGFVAVRQRLVDIEPFTDKEGIGRCRLVLDPTLVETRRQAKRPFQGWRYLPAADAPADIAARAGGDDMPAKLKAELDELGLL
jgi:hypothetical protein